jgi:hypothetical protein
MLSVFQILRRASAQREALAAAAEASLDLPDQQLLSAILCVHRAIEVDRNAFAHGILGVCDNLPDAILWLQSTDQMSLRIRFHMEQNYVFDEFEEERLAKLAYIYRLDDMERLSSDVGDLWAIWFEFMMYIRWPATSVEEYHQLCSRPRIAQELDRIRRGSNPLAQL